MPYNAQKIDKDLYGIWTPAYAKRIAEDADVPGWGGYFGKMGLRNRASGEREAYEGQLDRANQYELKMQDAELDNEMKKTWVQNAAPMATAGILAGTDPAQFGIQGDRGYFNAGDVINRDKTSAEAKKANLDAITMGLDRGIAVPDEVIGAAYTSSLDPKNIPIKHGYVTVPNSIDQFEANTNRMDADSNRIRALRPPSAGGGGGDYFSAEVTDEDTGVTRRIRTRDEGRANAFANGGRAPADAGPPPANPGHRKAIAIANRAGYVLSNGGKTATKDLGNGTYDVKKYDGREGWK